MATSKDKINDVTESIEDTSALAGDVSLHEDELLDELGLPALSWSADPADVLSAMKGDKKARAGAVRFVLPRDVGDWIVLEVEDEVLLEHLGAWAQSRS